MKLAGLHPVITHPERNGIIQAQTNLLASWVRLGCFVQVTGGSLKFIPITFGIMF